MLCQSVFVSRFWSRCDFGPASFAMISQHSETASERTAERTPLSFGEKSRSQQTTSTMEVASPLPFPPQAGTKRPFAFGSPDPGASAVAAAAGTAAASVHTMMEHDSAQTSEQLMADAFGQQHHHPAKRRRRFESSSDENVVNGTASFPAFGGGVWGASSSSPIKAAVPPHGTFPFLARSVRVLLVP